MRFNTFKYLKKKKCKTILIIIKNSTIQFFSENVLHFHNKYLYKNKDLKSISFKQSHINNIKSIFFIKYLLSKLFFKSKCILISNIIHYNLNLYFIFILGGDGTLLNASHFIQHAMVFSINSDPKYSSGALSLITIKKFDSVIYLLINNKISFKKLNRIKININHINLNIHPLNDILISHQIPSATSKFYIQINNISNNTINSGIWISTATGSTGVIASAGGVKQNIKDLRLQVFFREPYLAKKKLFKFMTSIKVKNKTNINFLGIDGFLNIYRFLIGSTIFIYSNSNYLFINTEDGS